MARCRRTRCDDPHNTIVKGQCCERTHLHVLFEGKARHGQLALEILAQNYEADEDELLFDQRHDVVVVLKSKHKKLTEEY